MLKILPLNYPQPIYNPHILACKTKFWSPLKSYTEDGRNYSDDDVELGDINKNINYQKKKELESQLVVSIFFIYLIFYGFIWNFGI